MKLIFIWICILLFGGSCTGNFESKKKESVLDEKPRTDSTAEGLLKNYRRFELSAALVSLESLKKDSDYVDLAKIDSLESENKSLLNYYNNIKTEVNLTDADILVWIYCYRLIESCFFF
jgi:hypothetical protein